MSETFMLYFNGKGKPPTEQQVEEAKRRRAVADDLFTLAMHDWHDKGGKAGPLDD